MLMTERAKQGHVLAGTDRGVSPLYMGNAVEMSSGGEGWKRGVGSKKLSTEDLASVARD